MVFVGVFSFKNINGFRVALLFVFALGMLDWADPSPAEAASCNHIKRQLASLSGSGRNAGRYAAAAKAQRKQISIVQRRMNARGCAASPGFFSREKHPSCRGLRRNLKEMRRNLAGLERRKSGGGGIGGFFKKQKRNRLQREYRRRRCDQPDLRRAGTGGQDITEQLFGSSKKRKRQAKRDRLALLKQRRVLRTKRRWKNTEETLKNYNTVRTICVRTCDGYYFPVSFSTTRDRVRRDAQACNNLCPGAPMELFFHKTTGETTEQMVSTIDKRPYSALPNAFAYRKAVSKTCKCNYKLLKRNIVALSAPSRKETREARRRELQVIAEIARPAWRVDRGQDPETQANIAGDFSLGKVAELNPTKEDAPNQVARARRVRVVGDVFLPTQ